MFQRFVIALLVATAGDLVEIGRVKDPAIFEVSGIVASRIHPGVFWIHNDSGNRPILYAIRQDGRVVGRFRTPFPNVDWEDVAVDERNRLYLADTGNNSHKLPIRTIYRIAEPTDLSEKETPIAGYEAFHYVFEGGKGFDCESLWIREGTAYLLSKRRDGGEAELYALSLDRPNTPFQPLRPKRIGRLDDFVEPATGADLSRDGKRLAVCSESVARVYERSDGGRLTLKAEIPYKNRQVEAIGWDGDELVLTDEPGRLFRIDLATLAEAERARRGKERAKR